MSVVPISHSTALVQKKKNSRCVSIDISPVPKGHGTFGSNNVHSDILHLLDAMNNSNRLQFQHSLCEVLQDQDDVMERLVLARQANDTTSDALYKNLRKKIRG